MAIRLRMVGGAHVALCAVETDPKPGDVYLDDSWHDWTGSGLIPGGQSARPPEADGEKVRNAAEEHERWAAETGTHPASSAPSV